MVGQAPVWNERTPVPRNPQPAAEPPRAATPAAADAPLREGEKHFLVPYSVTTTGSIKVGASSKKKARAAAMKALKAGDFSGGSLQTDGMKRKVSVPKSSKQIRLA